MTSTANLPHPSPEHASFSGRATSVVIRRGLVLLQLNAEGISKAKIQVIEYLATKNLATVILLQETHVTNPDVLNIPGYSLAAYTSSRVHGVATFVQCPTKWRDIASSTLAEEVEWVTTEVEGVNITNVYKPYGTRLCLDSIPRYQQPCIYAGGFNCHSTTWGYSSTNTDGTTLEHWASNTDVTLLYDPKQPRSFRSARWGTSTNPDLGFANLGTCASRRVLECFPKSQHRPSIIESSTTINSVPTRPVNRWNFRKADWAKFTDRLNTAANKLPSPTSEPNTAYKAWCTAILSAAKKTILRGCRKGLIPTWDEECQQLYDQFTRAEPGTIANVKAEQLTNTLDEKRREGWESTTASIDFTHSSRQAWQIFNRLTRRAKKTSPCPVSANAIASKLIENGRHRNVDKQVGRDVNAEIATLRGSVTTGDKSLTETFTEAEMQAAVGHLKSGKVQGPDHIAPEFISNCGTLMLTGSESFSLNACVVSDFQKSGDERTLSPS